MPRKTRAYRAKDLEGLFTHTLFYLAQCYGSLGKPAKGAEYCQRTLQRQLESGSFEPLVGAAGGNLISPAVFPLRLWLPPSPPPLWYVATHWTTEAPT